MKGTSLLLFDKSLNKWDRFALVWNPAFFILAGYWAITMHSYFELFAMLFFGVMFVLAYNEAKRKRELARIDAKVDAILKAGIEEKK
jgi:hypothetical protein